MITTQPWCSSQSTTADTATCSYDLLGLSVFPLRRDSSSDCCRLEVPLAECTGVLWKATGCFRDHLILGLMYASWPVAYLETRNSASGERSRVESEPTQEAEDRNAFLQREQTNLGS